MTYNNYNMLIQLNTTNNANYNTWRPTDNDNSHLAEPMMKLHLCIPILL